jgi:hypothetical protein
MPRPPILPALPLLALGLAGCMETGAGRYPSLLPRPIESQSLAEPERPVPVAEPDAALDARIAEVTKGLDAAAKSFATAAQNAEALVAVARGLPEGSEPWLDAQAALSEAEAQRGPVSIVLADLERLALDRGEAGKPPYPALDAALARAVTMANEQAARIATLDTALKTP